MLYDFICEDNIADFRKVTAEVSHNHPEGIKGAVATAGAAFLARTGATMDEITKLQTLQICTVRFFTHSILYN